MRIQEMDSPGRIAVYENNSSYQNELREDYPGLSEEEYIDLWLDTCVKYAGYDDIGPDFKRSGMIW